MSIEVVNLIELKGSNEDTKCIMDMLFDSNGNGYEGGLNIFIDKLREFDFSRTVFKYPSKAKINKFHNQYIFDYEEADKVNQQTRQRNINIGWDSFCHYSSHPLPPDLILTKNKLIKFYTRSVGRTSFVMKLSELFPDVEFHYDWYDLDMLNRGYFYVIQDGNIKERWKNYTA